MSRAREMSKSPKRIAQQALEAARRSLPPYGAKHSPKKFTQHQLFAMATLRQFFRTDYRGIVALLEDSSDLRDVLGLRSVPHYSTLAYAEKRFSQGGLRFSAAGYDSGCALGTATA
jgi:Transposase domain (DUF772)